MSLPYILSIGLGGALGSIARFGISHLVNGSYPAGTLMVNVLGSFLLGSLFAASKAGTIAENSPAFAFAAIGFCGAFTTFSTFSLEVFKLYSQGQAIAAVGHICANFALTLIAVFTSIFIVSNTLR